MLCYESALNCALKIEQSSRLYRSGEKNAWLFLDQTQMVISECSYFLSLSFSPLTIKYLTVVETRPSSSLFPFRRLSLSLLTALGQKAKIRQIKPLIEYASEYI